ncbi:folate family ECF transporter S component [Weissella coleopterorum]|uniref:Folate family ECF transporter S component n=1 Tax=Weissella coleopterorum TaxID=2714949 RepID=A0A6G8AZ60_9LACO|nr:folate family ECF transporter S component [Weissella coleopterorum]QIL50381.1 folate family ECF transporter S component [Weissella coleopterorum]
MKTLEYFRAPKLRTQTLALLGVLMALEIIISRFTIGNSFFQIGFTFITGGLIAKWYGPMWGIPVAFLIDFLTNLLGGQPYIIAFALVKLLSALIFGYSYYQKQNLSWWRLIVTIGVQLLLANVILNTILLGMYNFIPVHSVQAALTSPIVWARALKSLIMWPVEVIISYLIFNNKQLMKLAEQIF